MIAITRTAKGAILASVFALSACGNDPDAAIGYKSALKTIAAVTSKKEKGTATAGAGPNQATLVNRALGAVKGPVLIALTQGGMNTAVMGEHERNGSYQTFTTTDRQTLTIKRGVVTSTRGLGEDLMSSEADNSIALIRARRAGNAQRTYRYLDGIGKERPLKVKCKVLRDGSDVVVNPTGGKISAIRMGEICTSGGLKITNIYWVSADGFIWQSRQWVGPGVGDIALQHLRR